MQKRLLTIQDYSCLGRCSLTVALPTISACGIECVGIPTSILSNHTQYKSWTFDDLSNSLLPIVNKWDGYNNHFDMIYTGYLSTSQVDIVKEIISKLKRKDTLIYVDPAMADNGKLYTGFGLDHVEKMKELLRYADFIKPNVTEACLLTGSEYHSEEMPKAYYIDLVNKLVSLGAKNVILTGIKNKNKIGIMLFEKEKEEISYLEFDYVDAYLHGTGDLFSSAVTSMLTLGKSLKESLEIAHKYVIKSIEYTMEDKLDGMLYGPEFEKAIPYLVGLIK